MKSSLKKATRHKVWLLLVLIAVVASGTLLRSTAEDRSLPSEPASGPADAPVAGLTTMSLKPILNLRLPLEYYEDGRVKAYLIAEEAKVPADLTSGGRIEAKQVRVELYSETGTNVETVITAEDCVYDKKDGKASSQTTVRLERQDLTISGVGFEWNAKDQVVRVLSNVKVTMSENLNLKGIPK